MMPDTRAADPDSRRCGRCGNAAHPVRYPNGVEYECVMACGWRGYGDGFVPLQEPDDRTPNQRGARHQGARL